MTERKTVWVVIRQTADAHVEIVGVFENEATARNRTQGVNNRDGWYYTVEEVEVEP